MAQRHAGQLSVTITGLKHAFDDMEPLATPCGVAIPGFDGDIDQPLQKPFIAARLRRDLQSTAVIRQTEASWHPSTLEFSVQEEDVWMRLELHDAALSSEQQQSDQAGSDEVSRSGFSGRLKSAMSSFSSPVAKRGSLDSVNSRSNSFFNRLKRPDLVDGSLEVERSDLCSSLSMARNESRNDMGNKLQSTPMRTPRGSFSTFRKSISSVPAKRGKPLESTPARGHAAKHTSSPARPPVSVKAMSTPVSKASSLLQGMSLTGSPSTRTAVPTFLGRVDVKVADLGQEWIMTHTFFVQDRYQRRIATLQVSSMFVPLAREGWLQMLVTSAAPSLKRWVVVWVELLEDGKLSWFDGPRKRRTDLRGTLALDYAEAIGLSSKFGRHPNAAAHFEVQARVPRRRGTGKRLTTLVFKANHPDEAGVWIDNLMCLWKCQPSQAGTLPAVEAMYAPALPPSHQKVPRQHRRSVSAADRDFAEQENDAMLLQQVAAKTRLTGRPPTGSTTLASARLADASPLASPFPNKGPRGALWSTPTAKRPSGKPAARLAPFRAALSPSAKRGPKDDPGLMSTVSTPGAKQSTKKHVPRLALGSLTNLQGFADQPSARQVEAADLIALRPPSHRMPGWR